MRLVALFLTVLTGVVFAAGSTKDADAPRLIPQPKQVQWQKQVPVGADDCVIVLGKAADPVEQYAAEFLRDRVAKRFGVTWPIIVEGQPSGHKVAILVGGRKTHGQLNQICDRQKIELSESSPGFDGYVIETVNEGRQTTVIVGGGNHRGTLYGTDTLFQLFQGEGDKLVFHGASIRDYPTVPWRGRPQTDVSQHLLPGMMDCYAVSRINFIDLRKGIYAYEPGHKFTQADRAEIDAAIKEARRRGIVVLGCVNCGVSRSLHDGVEKTFREFISFGVDGIWLSFDDKGPGESPEELTFNMLGLAKEHGIPASLVAITPPKGSYQVIQAPFNARIMKVPGMEQAWWFWTTVPSEEINDVARSIGIKVMPSWWHNWPRPKSGLTHIGEGSQLDGGRRSYLPLPSMAEGWHRPDYQELAAGGKYLHALMPWGGNAWLHYYVVPVIGWWGWDAESHDWAATRGRIYEIVFGRSQVVLAYEFDDLLSNVKSFFICAEGRSERGGAKPARLKNPSDKQTVLEMLDKLDVLLGQIEKNSPKQTMIDQDSLRTQGLDAMRSEIQTGKITVKLGFPEYWWDDQQRAILNAIYDGESAKAQQLIDQGRQRLLADIAPIGEQLSHLKQTRGYVDRWTKIGGRDVAQWQKLIAERKVQVPRLVWECGYYSVKLDELLKELNNPPLGRGYGAGQRGLRALASALPVEREQYRGQWICGVADYKGSPMAVFSIDSRDSCNAGDYGELPVTLPITGPRDRLGLLVFMNSSTKDAFGLEMVPERWYGYASARLIWDEKVVWEADLGLSRDGGEWDLVRLPVIPENVKEIQLRLRVEDRKDSSYMRTFVAVGPIRLVEMPD